LPASTIDIIRQRAELYRIIRDYFHHQDVLEVEVPLLGRSSALDPHLESMSLESRGDTYYLQTSPELFMKRLLSQDSGSIFSICKSFRAGEASTRHNPEFTMLEWYRLEFSLESLIEDVAGLIKKAIPTAFFETITYADLFQDCLGINPHQCSDDELHDLVVSHTSYQDKLDRPSSLDLIMSQVIEPAISKRTEGLFVVDYPACQAAMSQIDFDHQGNRVARRFELYMLGVELANGYLELTDADEQCQRFARDAHYRIEQGLPQIPEDKEFLKALDNGVPACSGVALGLDRLMWVRHSINHGAKGDINLSDYILFPWHNL